MQRVFFFSAVIGLSLSFAVSSLAQEAPIDISAQESLEWYEDTGLYVARGAARASRGTTLVEADILSARRRADATGQEKKGPGDIDLVVAEGNVRISDGKHKIFGSRAVYDLDEKTFKVTGDKLKYVTDSDVVTARDSLEYHESRGIAVARGKALAQHAGSRIEADILSATFGPGVSGRTEMKKMMAQGNVAIVTKDGNVAQSKRAVYDVKRDVAVLIENVRIRQGETQLAGDEAEVDFKTGKSRIINSGSGRVRVLLPASSGTKKKEDKR